MSKEVLLLGTLVLLLYFGSGPTTEKATPYYLAKPDPVGPVVDPLRDGSPTSQTGWAYSGGYQP